MTDHSCFIGSWPFYKLDGEFSSLLSEHRESGIEKGFVSSLESVFYNDFYESERELSGIIAGSGYYHTVTPNPTVQGYEQTLERCFSEFCVKGIRLVPGYHGYSLFDIRLEPIIAIAKERNIPIFVNARLTDERMTHIIHPTLPKIEEYAKFADAVSGRGVKVVLCYLLGGEADAVWRMTENRENLYFDTSGMSGSLFEADLPEYAEHCLLGTGFPLRTVRSAVMRIEKEITDPALKARMLG